MKLYAYYKSDDINLSDLDNIINILFILSKNSGCSYYEDYIFLIYSCKNIDLCKNITFATYVETEIYNFINDNSKYSIFKNKYKKILPNFVMVSPKIEDQKMYHLKYKFCFNYEYNYLFKNIDNVDDKIKEFILSYNFLNLYKDIIILILCSRSLDIKSNFSLLNNDVFSNIILLF